MNGLEEVEVGAMPRVLLVEDDRDCAAVLARWLREGAHIDVAVANSGAMAMELAQESGFDAVVSDIELPDRCGLDVVRRSKELWPLRGTMLITASERMEYGVQAVRAGVDALLLKPLTRHAVIQGVQDLVAESRKRAIASERVVMAIGAHPDDVEIGCGGTLLRHRARGDRVVVVSLTRGEGGGDPARRYQELVRAANMMKAELLVGDFVDTEVPEGARTIRFLEAAVAQVRPTVIYTHSAHDRHQDHRNTHAASMVAARAVPTVLCYQSPSSTREFEPGVFMGIDEHLDAKLAVLTAYESQQAARPYLDAEFVRSSARYWGRFAGYGHVEPLEVQRVST